MIPQSFGVEGKIEHVIFFKFQRSTRRIPSVTQRKVVTHRFKILQVKIFDVVFDECDNSNFIREYFRLPKTVFIEKGDNL